MTFPLLSLTLATLRSPELGFFGFVIPTRTQTPFSSGWSFMAGDVGFRARCSTLHPRRTWLYVAFREQLEENVRFAVMNDDVKDEEAKGDDVIDLVRDRVAAGSCKSDRSIGSAILSRS